MAGNAISPITLSGGQLIVTGLRGPFFHTDGISIRSGGRFADKEPNQSRIRGREGGLRRPGRATPGESESDSRRIAPAARIVKIFRVKSSPAKMSTGDTSKGVQLEVYSKYIR